MKWVGWLAATVGLAAGILLGSLPATFLNVPGLLFVLLVGGGVLWAAHGVQDIGLTLKAVFSTQTSKHDAHRAGRVAETATQAFVAAGWVGVLVGVVQILSALEDPAQLGLGMATALLTAFYGHVLGYLICMPLARSLAGRTA